MLHRRLASKVTDINVKFFEEELEALWRIKRFLKAQDVVNWELVEYTREIELALWIQVLE